MSGAIDPNSLTSSKWALDSKRAWGALMMAVPLVLQLTGINLSPGDSAQVTAALQHAQSGFADLMIALGAVQMLYGSWKAQQPLHLLTPYQVDDEGKKVVPLKPLVLHPGIAEKMDEHPVT